MVNKRDRSIDTVAGLMILYMMFIHYGHPANLETFASILHYSLFYFMAWFFFKTGVFYKEQCLKEEWHSCYKRLLIPFICFTIFGQIVEWIRRFLENDTNWMHYIISPIKEVLYSGYTNGNFPLWFLFTMFFARLTYACMSRIFHVVAYKNTIIMISYISLYLLFSNMRNYVQLPIYCYNIPLAIVFMTIRMLMKYTQYKLWLILICICIYAVLGLTSFSYVVFMTGNLEEGDSYISFILLSFAGIVIINNLFKYICRWYSFPLLSYLGRNSMIFFAMHIPILSFSSLIYNSSITLFSYIANIIVICIIIFANIILKRYNYRWILGK